MKTYHIYQAEAKQAEVKLRNVEQQKAKVEQQLSGKNTTSRKLKGLERQSEKVRGFSDFFFFILDCFLNFLCGIVLKKKCYLQKENRKL
jgi:hypothetical protein